MGGGAERPRPPGSSDWGPAGKEEEGGLLWGAQYLADWRRKQPLPTRHNHPNCATNGLLVLHSSLPNDSFLTLVPDPQDSETLLGFFVLFFALFPSPQPEENRTNEEGRRALGNLGNRGWECGFRSCLVGTKASLQLLGLCTQLMGGWQRQIVVYF